MSATTRAARARRRRAWRARCAAQELSSVEVDEHLLGRFASHERLGVGAGDRRRTRRWRRPRAADRRRAAGDAGPLVGVPIAHKDIFVTRDLPTTAGSRMLAGYRSPFDATVVARLAEAGTVTLGKLNCDEFAMGSSNENSASARSPNPWDASRVPGGSSGGSAAAVAARLLPAATGTDTGGSIRQPASFCGITGIKPTYGVCSRYGMIAFASSLDQAGPLARSAEDCALLLGAMSGFDPRDSTSAERPPQDFHAAARPQRARAPPPARPLRACASACRRSSSRRRWPRDVETARCAPRWPSSSALGATLVDVQLPRTELSIPVYYLIAPAEASSNLSRFDGVRYGHRAAHYDDLHEHVQEPAAAKASAPRSSAGS